MIDEVLGPYERNIHLLSVARWKKKLGITAVTTIATAVLITRIFWRAQSLISQERRSYKSRQPFIRSFNEHFDAFVRILFKSKIVFFSYVYRRYINYYLAFWCKILGYYIIILEYKYWFVYTLENSCFIYISYLPPCK